MQLLMLGAIYLLLSISYLIVFITLLIIMVLINQKIAYLKHQTNEQPNQSLSANRGQKLYVMMLVTYPLPFFIL